MIINMDTNRKCSHFIGYFNHMMSNSSHLNPENVVTFKNLIVVLFMVHSYENIPVIVLENAVHNGTNVFKEYIRLQTTHLDGY